jgi:hypothetical protein
VLVSQARERQVGVAFGMVFLDESGHFSSTDFVCMAGYMATGDGWEALCVGWRFLLREKYKIPALHMREIMSPAGKSPAASWDRDHKVDMLRDFILLIRKHTEVGFGCALDARHYREVVKTIAATADAHGLKAKPFKAQMFCMARVVRLVMQYLDDTNASEDERKTSLMFDDDEQYSRICYGLLCDLKKRIPAIKKSVVNICFGDDEWYYPLQAADLLSYASCNELKKGSNGWKDSNVFSDLLKDEDPTYGKRYLSELWSDGEEDSKALMEAIIRETVQFQEGVK